MTRPCCWYLLLGAPRVVHNFVALHGVGLSPAKLDIAAAIAAAGTQVQRARKADMVSYNSWLLCVFRGRYDMAPSPEDSRYRDCMSPPCATLVVDNVSPDVSAEELTSIFVKVCTEHGRVFFGVLHMRGTELTSVWFISRFRSMRAGLVWGNAKRKACSFRTGMPVLKFGGIVVVISCTVEG